MSDSLKLTPMVRFATAPDTRQRPLDAVLAKRGFR